LLFNCSEGDCVTPYSLNAQLLDSTNYLFSWTGVGESLLYNLRLKKAVDPDWTLIENYAYDTITFDQLDWCTDYEFQVQAICSDTSSSEFSISYFFTSNGCCMAPEDIGITNITDSSATLSWSPVLAAIEYHVFVLEGGDVGVFDGSTTDTSIVFENLFSCSTYDYLFSVECQDGEMIEVEMAQFDTKGCGACIDFEYCESSGETTEFEWIQSVQIEDLLFESGDNEGYVFYEGTNIIFSSEHTYQFTLTPGFAGTSYNEYFKVWLDINQNGQFDNDELIFDAGSAQAEPLITNITMPENMPEGFTRMRIAMQWDDPMESCGSIAAGEVEDYCVTIDNAVGISEANAKDYFEIYPNPASDVVLIKIVKPGENNLQIIDASGKTIYFEKISNSSASVDVSSWDSGLYLVKLQTGTGIIQSSILVVSH
jgi:hypothetical protein